MDWVADFCAALFGYLTLALDREREAANDTQNQDH
jgi:hypothetical protein